MNTKFQYKLITLFFVIFMVCFALAFYAFGWTEPTVAPPAGNVDVPINIGAIGQVRTGPLGIGGIFHAYSNAYVDGMLGISTTSPDQVLDVAGNADITGDLGFMGSTNKWIFHTPDDGRTTLYIAPDPGGDGWDWSNVTIFESNGDVSFSGMLGIGTTSPNEPLHVIGDARVVNGTFQVDNGDICQTLGATTTCLSSVASGVGVTSISQGSGITLSPNPIASTGTISVNETYVQRRIVNNCTGASQSIKTIAQDGTVTCELDDLGTHTATQNLDMAGNSIVNLPLTPTNPNDAASKSYVDSQAAGGNPGGLDGQIQYNNAGAFGGAEIYYNTDGFGNPRLGIGISPTEALHVNGDVIVTGSQLIIGSLNTSGLTSTSTTYLATTSGNVRIGSAVAPLSKLDVTGDIHATEDICTDLGGGGAGVCLSTLADLPIGCADGQIAKYNTASGLWECADETGGSLDCVTVTNSGSGSWPDVSVSCPAGYEVTGGGFYTDARLVTRNHPTATGWRCKQDIGDLTCYVRCCRLQ